MNYYLVLLVIGCQRVKVYRLNDDGKWDDRGTGHVTVDYLEVCTSAERHLSFSFLIILALLFNIYYYNDWKMPWFYFFLLMLISIISLALIFLFL